LKDIVYRKALLIRETENAFLSLFTTGKLNGTVHTCNGQEFSALAFCSELQGQDVIHSNHRCHGHYIAHSGDVRGLIAELMGKASGVCGGIGSSQHLCKDGFFSNGIQGGIVPIATGMALAAKRRGGGAIAVVFIGDGTLGEGVVYESMNLASLLGLPLHIVCENNNYAQSTQIIDNLAGSILARPESFGLKTYHSNTWDVEALFDNARASIEAARSNHPVFHLVDTYRLNHHSKSDDKRDPEEVAKFVKKDPLNVFRDANAKLYQSMLQEIDSQITGYISELENEDELEPSLYLELSQRVVSLRNDQNKVRELSPSVRKMILDKGINIEKVRGTGRNDRIIKRDVQKYLSTLSDHARFNENNMTQKKEALEYIPVEYINERVATRINAFFDENMAHDKKLFFVGEDVLSPYGGAFNVAAGLSIKYPENVISTPISEAAITGLCNGLALSGFKPYLEIMFGDFITLSLDQIINHSSKFHHMYNKQVNCPIVIRTPMGGGRGYGPTHSQTMDKFLVGIPNVTVVAINTFIDPKIIYQNIYDNEKHPVIVIENKVDYGSFVGSVKLDYYFIERSTDRYPTVKCSPKVDTPTLTLVTYGGISRNVINCIHELFQEVDLIPEVIVLCKLSPLDISPVLDSVSITKRVVIIEEGGKEFGVGAEIIAQAVEKLGGKIILAKRIGALTVPIPSARGLEDFVLPNTTLIKDIAQELS